MVRIAVLAEHAPLVEAAAATLRGDNRFEVTAVVGTQAGLEAPGVREALAEAQVLVNVPARVTERLPWPAMSPGPRQALVILDLTGQLGPERALSLGARGYLGADEPSDVWAPRLLQASEGKPAYPPGSTDALQAQLLEAERQARGLYALSKTQLDAVRLYARNLSVKQIALTLDISETSVRGRLSRSMKLLGVDTLQGLAALAGRLGLDSEEQEPPAAAADEVIA